MRIRNVVLIGDDGDVRRQEILKALGLYAHPIQARYQARERIRSRRSGGNSHRHARLLIRRCYLRIRNRCSRRIENLSTQGSRESLRRRRDREDQRQSQDCCPINQPSQAAEPAGTPPITHPSIKVHYLPLNSNCFEFVPYF